jgi:hypothetical protein
MSVKAATSTDNQVGNLVYKLWRGSNISGSNAVLISSTYFSSSRNPAVGGGPAQIGNTGTRLTSSFSLPSTTFRTEYLFIQTYWSIDTAGGNNNDDEVLVFGNNSLVKPTPFVAEQRQFIRCAGGDD